MGERTREKVLEELRKLQLEVDGLKPSYTMWPFTWVEGRWMTQLCIGSQVQLPVYITITDDNCCVAGIETKFETSGSMHHARLADDLEPILRRMTEKASSPLAALQLLQVRIEKLAEMLRKLSEDLSRVKRTSVDPYYNPQATKV